MEAQVFKGLSLSESEAINEAKAAGLYPVTIDVPPTTNDFHWHDFSTTIYILEGSLEVTERDSGVTYILVAGDKALAGPRFVHREKHDGFKAVFAFDQDPATLKMPINRSPAELAAE